jgi:hypothetical protein
LGSGGDPADVGKGRCALWSIPDVAAFPRQLLLRRKIDMNAIAAKLLPPISELALRKSGSSLYSVLMFSGIGLVMSVSVLILDQQIPGEWF